MADHDGTTRGQFLSLSTVGLGAMIGGVIGVPATAFLLAPITEEITFKPVLLGNLTEFPSEGTQFKPIAATYVEDPKNPFTSAGLAWVHNTGKQGTTWNAADAMFIVFSNRCMHLGCPVAAGLSGFACPCHGGQYNTEGQRIAGPPIRPLDRFQWEIQQGQRAVDHPALERRLRLLRADPLLRGQGPGPAGHGARRRHNGGQHPVSRRDLQLPLQVTA